MLTLTELKKIADIPAPGQKAPAVFRKPPNRQQSGESTVQQLVTPRS